MASNIAPTRPDAIRRHNLAVMLSHLHRDGAMTRANLTQRLGVSRSTIAALVSDLTQLGLVREAVPTGGVGVGRPSHVVALHPDGPFAVAIDVDIAHVTVAAVGLGGVVLARRVVSTTPELSAPEDVARLAVESIEAVRAEGCPSSTLAGIGVSIPGTVDRQTGRIGVAPNLGWHDAALGALLKDLAPAAVPVVVGNDADLAVLAELRRGSARDCEDVVYLLGRVGVGAGIIVGGEPLRGHNGHAGEIGHNVVDPTGPLCHCGKRGCTETYLGERAILERAGRTDSPTPDDAVAALFADAGSGDARALEAVHGVADELGRTLASLTNTLNPQRIVLGGSLAAVLALARPEVETALERFALEAPMRTVTLVEPGLGTDSALVGAAEVAFAELLDDPLVASAQIA